jgi:YD repeat-containing protein
VDGDGNSTVDTYDAAGQVLTSQTFATNGTLASSVANTYDGAGNLVKSVDGDGNATVNVYDADGQVLSSQSYDAAGALIDFTNAVYDLAGNQVQSVDGNSDITVNAYNALGEVTSQTLGWGTLAAAAAQMRTGRSGLRNPLGTEWHHPVDNPDVMILLRRQVHRDPALQSILHPENIGGFGTFYGK